MKILCILPAEKNLSDGMAGINGRKNVSRKNLSSLRAAERGKSGLMRWFHITRADIEPKIREVLELRGAETVRAVLMLDNLVIDHPDGTRLTVSELRVCA